MDELPIDMRNPRVKEYLSLIRLQVLTPLSLLINIAAVSVCAFVVSPSISQVEKLYPTSISPRPAFIAVYIAAVYVGQIGYCLQLVFARKPETKATISKGVGLSLVFANWVMAAWAIAWVFKQFLASTILLGILLLLLLYSNINLLVYHPPTTSRPLDMALIHAPLRFFLALPFQLMFFLSLFIELGLTYEPTSSGPPRDYTKYPWSGFGVVFGTSLISLLVVILRRDIVWCVASTWITASIWARKYVPTPVYIIVILFTVLQPISLFAALTFSYFGSRGKQQGPIALDGDDHPALHDRDDQNNDTSRGPREVDTEAVWG